MKCTCAWKGKLYDTFLIRLGCLLGSFRKWSIHRCLDRLSRCQHKLHRGVMCRVNPLKHPVQISDKIDHGQRNEPASYYDAQQQRKQQQKGAGRKSQGRWREKERKTAHTLTHTHIQHNTMEHGKKERISVWLDLVPIETVWKVFSAGPTITEISRWNPENLIFEESLRTVSLMQMCRLRSFRVIHSYRRPQSVKLPDLAFYPCAPNPRANNSLCRVEWSSNKYFTKFLYSAH